MSWIASSTLFCSELNLPTLRFCTMRQLPPLESLRQIRLDDLLLYMRWYLDKHDVKKLNTFYVRMPFWRMMYSRKMQKRLDLAMASEMKNVCLLLFRARVYVSDGKQFIGVDLRVEYDLDETSDDKPTMNVDDLFLLLYHHWMLCTDRYAIERERIQHALLILLMVYTTARPSTILPGNKSNSNDCIKYKDIELFKVRDPEDKSNHILVMKIRLRLMKGRRNKGAPSVFP